MNDPYVLCVTLNPVLDTFFHVAAIRPVYRTEASRVTHVAGGKGNNVARGLVTLGEAACSLVALGGMIGRDIAEVMAADTYAFKPAWVSGESRLQITVADAAGEQRAFYAPAVPFTAKDAVLFREEFEQLLPAAWAVAVCGSTPGGGADLLVTELLRRASGRGLPTLLDSYGPGLAAGLAASPAIVKMNRKEAVGWLGREILDRAGEIAALDALCLAAGGWAVLTLGEDGALFAAAGQRWAARPPPVRALNPIGSGDAMTAGLLAGLRRGLAPVECFRLGMAAAAANTLTWDACRFSSEDVERLCAAVPIEELPA